MNYGLAKMAKDKAVSEKEHKQNKQGLAIGTIGAMSTMGAAQSKGIDGGLGSAKGAVRGASVGALATLPALAIMDYQHNKKKGKAKLEKTARIHEDPDPLPTLGMGALGVAAGGLIGKGLTKGKLPNGILSDKVVAGGVLGGAAAGGAQYRSDQNKITKKNKEQSLAKLANDESPKERGTKKEEKNKVGSIIGSEIGMGVGGLAGAGIGGAAGNIMGHNKGVENVRGQLRGGPLKESMKKPHNYTDQIKNSRNMGQMKGFVLGGLAGSLALGHLGSEIGGKMGRKEKDPSLAKTANMNDEPPEEREANKARRQQALTGAGLGVGGLAGVSLGGRMGAAIGEADGKRAVGRAQNEAHDAAVRFRDKKIDLTNSEHGLNNPHLADIADTHEKRLAGIMGSSAYTDQIDASRRSGRLTGKLRGGAVGAVGLGALGNMLGRDEERQPE